MAGRHVELFKGRGGKWRYRLVGGNGEKQTASQPYFSKGNARRGARSAHPGVRVVEA
jgi:uncharacterized protein YegP (UPF0339 family)